jgi:hypothetical protein
MNRELRITFVLPRTGEWPSGGLRIVYEHANYLARRSHVVNVVHPGRLTKEPTRFDQMKNVVRYALRKADGRYTPNAWLSRTRGFASCACHLSQNAFCRAEML